ncbi:protein of unknown function [Hathewaya proteolytica DSM 3090]|uniref:DUF4829 domain-containing protein n=1 Tax=Hathewaya proteolytica DSM 3090 TaxID=1121331 RepID=A0A1M6MC00_9CLOT|nr:DUF4829 domain-containing protein [Hathewaya proteolytica]SHJ81012.1 protein of unknown function [Hathewaya proteolytica DSM 3090]
MDKRIKRICCIAIIVSVSILTVACGKKEQNIDKGVKAGSGITDTTKGKSNEAKISDDDLKQAENVVKDYFKAQKERDYKTLYRCLQAYDKHVQKQDLEKIEQEMPEIKGIYKVFEPTEIVLEGDIKKRCTGNKDQLSFKPENLVTLKVTYKLETTKENVLTEPDGIHTKWTTLLKDEETNKWSILSPLGY